MTLQTQSVQAPSAALHPAPTQQFIAPTADIVVQGFSLAKEYFFERSLFETVIEGVIAATFVAALYFAYSLLIALVVVWCLTILGIAGYRLLGAA